MFHFPSLASFNAVKDEISIKIEEYKEYFIWRNLNFSSFDKVTLATNLITEDINLLSMNNIIQQFQLVPNSENEIDYKYEMMYKNFLLNTDGLVEINGEIAQFSSNSINYFRNIEHYQEFVNNKSTPIRIFNLNKQSSNSYNTRATEASCTCRKSFDNGAGLKCLDRRVKGCLEIEFYAYDEENSFCMVEYDMEASTRFYKKVLGIWWKYKADVITVTADFSVINRRGGIENNICFLGPKSKSENNKSEVCLPKTLRCEAILFKDNRCLDEDDNHDINSGDSSHSAVKAGECNGSVLCNISNCIN
jgi:hypothetical protein